jgi:hypothetical protein
MVSFLIRSAGEEKRREEKRREKKRKENRYEILINSQLPLFYYV